MIPIGHLDKERPKLSSFTVNESSLVCYCLIDPTWNRLDMPGINEPVLYVLVTYKECTVDTSNTRVHIT